MGFILNTASSVKKYLPDSIWKFGSTLYWKVTGYKYLVAGRPFVPGETTKARERRIREGFFEKYTLGKGLDIGFGGDPIVEGVRGWDFEHGDAQYLKGINDNYFDFVYSSHTLEHMVDAGIALKNWYRVVKPGGYLVLSIPHRDLYEKKRNLPSRFNDNHLHFFLPYKNDPPDTIGVEELIKTTLSDFEIIYLKECSENHTITDPMKHSDGEYSIEVVIRKNQ